MLLGCKDGYIREVLDTATNDDGTTISSNIRFQPIALTDGDTEGVLTAVHAILAESSADVTLKVYVGQTAEQCMTETTPRVARTLTAGRNAITRQPVRGRYAQVELVGTGRWALENLYVTLRPGGLAGLHNRT